MTSLQGWLSKPRTTVRIDSTIPWAAWMKKLRRPFSGDRADPRPRIEVLDRVSLGGKKSLLLISVGKRRMLIGVGDTDAPSLLSFEQPCQSTGSNRIRRGKKVARGTRRGLCK